MYFHPQNLWFDILLQLQSIVAAGRWCQYLDYVGFITLLEPWKWVSETLREWGALKNSVYVPFSWRIQATNSTHLVRQLKMEPGPFWNSKMIIYLKFRLMSQARFACNRLNTFCVTVLWLICCWILHRLWWRSLGYFQILRVVFGGKKNYNM